MSEDDQKPCGATLEIDFENIMVFGRTIVMTTEPVTLVCSRPWGHTPADRHSDGVTDWMGDEDQ